MPGGSFISKGKPSTFGVCSYTLFNRTDAILCVNRYGVIFIIASRRIVMQIIDLK
jgi:hypothetical protein